MEKKLSARQRKRSNGRRGGEIKRKRGFILRIVGCLKRGFFMGWGVH